MHPIIAFIRLIRIQNLLIIAGTQYLFRHFIYEQKLLDNGLELVIEDHHFFMISLSTVMIAAAGYIINDYFDLKIDRINKPEKIIVGRTIKRRIAMAAHIVINSIGVLMGTFVAYAIGMIELSMIFIFSAMALWYYATTFKRQVLVGNVIIALLAAMVPLIVGLFEVPQLNQIHNIQEGGSGNFNVLAYWAIGFAAFAFVYTLAREITKDMADIEGDEQYDCQTVPIAYGIATAKNIVVGIYILALGMIYYVQQTWLGDDSKSFLYITIFVALPTVFVSFKTFNGKERKDFLVASNLNKLITVLGVCYCFLAAYLIQNPPTA